MLNLSDRTAEARVFALCSATSDATIVASPLQDDNSSFGSGAATCPAGTRAVGGGVGLVESIGPSLFSVDISGPVDETGQAALTDSGDVARSWFATTATKQSTASSPSARRARTRRSRRSCSPSRRRSGSPTARRCNCPAGKRALGGGVGVTGAGGGTVHASGPVDETGQTATIETGDVARGWFGFVANILGDGNARIFRVLAICASDAPTTAAAGPGQAKVRCAGKAATIVGTAGPDALQGTAGADVIAGLGGNDKITGLGGNDTVCGGSGNDSIAGGAGNDKLYGELGNDRLSGGPGNDILLGGPGVDSLDGGPGRNTVKP